MKINLFVPNVQNKTTNRTCNESSFFAIFCIAHKQNTLVINNLNIKNGKYKKITRLKNGEKYEKSTKVNHGSRRVKGVLTTTKRDPKRWVDPRADGSGSGCTCHACGI